MVSSKTKLVFLTDGMLIRALMNDPLLQDHSYVFIDEAHERTINSDILIGVLKDLVSWRANTKNPLKLIIMSATIEVDKFIKYFHY